MRHHFVERRGFVFFARFAVVMAAFSVLLQLLLLYYITEPVASVDLWCGKRYKPEYVSVSHRDVKYLLKVEIETSPLTLVGPSYLLASPWFLCLICNFDLE